MHTASQLGCHVKMANLSDAKFLFLLKHYSWKRQIGHWKKLGKEGVDILLKDIPLSKHIAWDFKQPGQVEDVLAHGRGLRTKGSLSFFPTQTYSVIVLFNVSFGLEQKSKDLCLVCATQSDGWQEHPRVLKWGLTKAVAAAPMALPHHTTHGPSRAAEVPAARSHPSLA